MLLRAAVLVSSPRTFRDWFISVFTSGFFAGLLDYFFCTGFSGATGLFAAVMRVARLTGLESSWLRSLPSEA
jgi:hypothetical protein